jgi:hypothetical protein
VCRGQLGSWAYGMGVHGRMSWGIQGGGRTTAGHPLCRQPSLNGHKAVSGVAVCPHGIEGSGMAGPGESLGSPWPPLAIHSCSTS